MTNALLLRRRGMMIDNVTIPTELYTVYPSSYKDQKGTLTNVSNGYTPYTSNTYSQNKVSSDGEGYITYTFDLSGLPNDAIIVSAQCIAKGRRSNSLFEEQWMEVFSGNKSVSYSFPNASESTFTYDLLGWTKEEILQCAIRLYANSSNTASYIRFFGATLIIEYHL